MNNPYNIQKIKSIYFNSNIKNFTENLNTKYIYRYDFDIKYELLSPIIKDIQMASQLIKCIKNHQLSDLVMINGNNSYSIESRFYFNYRIFIDFYVKVIDFIETDYCTKIKYNIYKTKPILNNFFVNLFLFKNDENENSSKLVIEIILSKDKNISQRILDIIYKEFDYNFLYLSQAIKMNKNNSVFYGSSNIKIEFNILKQIIQNIKLIEYIINAKLQKIIKKDKIEEFKNSESNNNFKDNDYNKFIHLNEIYNINLNKKKEIKDCFSLNNIQAKVQLLIEKEDKLVIQYRLYENETNQNNNLITIHIRKLTPNSSFILIKAELINELPEKIVTNLKKIIRKSVNKIEKLSQISKNNF